MFHLTHGLSSMNKKSPLNKTTKAIDSSDTQQSKLIKHLFQLNDNNARNVLLLKSITFVRQLRSSDVKYYFEAPSIGLIL